MPIRIAPLAEANPDAIEALLDAAFGAERRARTAYRIRAGAAAIPDLSFAAFDDGVLAGTLQSWPVQIGDAPLTLVGPVAVAPERQRSGIGHAMMERLIAAARGRPLAMIGDPEYYGRFFGFTADATGGWDVPGPVERHRLLARNAGSLPRTGALGPRVFAKANAAA
ncbi:MAG: N-acetyltransferase [Sphingomonadaceae bacterium]|nr:N-acetyltransferase [Sphingomonadaceae bacterium]